jgi:hypothetical protein
MCLNVNSLWVLACALALCAASTHAQGLADAPGPDPRFDDGQSIVAETFLGPITVGVANLSDDQATRTTSADVELGYIYQLTLNQAFPKVAEIKPFLFNRAESTEATYYESLGIGAGVRLSIAEQYEASNWFLKLGILTPNETYRERYNTDRELSSIVEVIVGYEFPLNQGSTDREMNRRITPPDTIRLRVPATLFDPAQVIEPDTLQRIHTLVIQAYLSITLQRVDPAGNTEPTRPEPHFRAIHRVQRATGTKLTPTQQHLLTDKRATDPNERAAIRREIVATYLRQGLNDLMREKYPLLIEARSADAALSIAKMSRPGVRLTPSDQPLDADAMIEHYIQTVTASIK